MLKIIGFILLVQGFVNIQAEAQAQASRCQSVIREFLRDGSVRLEVKDMATSKLGEGLYFYEDSREGWAFSVNETSGYLLFTISKGPDFMDGTTSRSGFDDQGRATLSVAEGNKVFRIECRK